MIPLLKSNCSMSASDKTVLELLVSQRKAAQNPTASDSEFWEFFTAEKILRDFQLSPEDIDAGVVGQESTDQKGSDGGIDSMYLLVNSKLITDVQQAKDLVSMKGAVRFEIIIIQARGNAGFGLEVLNRLSNTSESIFQIALNPTNFSEEYNEPLLDIIDRFRAAHEALLSKHPHICVNFFYVAKHDSTGVDETVRAKAKELEQKICGILSTISQCKVEFLGARDLITIHNKAPKFNFTLQCIDSFTDSNGGYVALVTLGEFFNLISDQGSLREHLFESNVRDYEGDVDVNKQIRATLTDSKGADFWWLNNGITILSTHVSGHSTQLAMDEPSIVNGLQTSKEMFEHFKASALTAKDDKRHVVMRIIQSPDEALQDRIIRATNSQTKIPPQFLRSSDDRQRDIEIFFRGNGLHYDRRKNSWRKSDLPLDKIVGMSELARSVGAVLKQEPDQARGRPSRYFKDEHYRSIFGGNTSLRTYLVCALLKKKAQAFLNAAEPDRKHRNNLLYYLLTAVRHILLKRRIKRRFIKLDEIDTTSDFTDAFNKALSIVLPIYKKHGKTDKAAKGVRIAEELREVLKPKQKRNTKVKT